VTTVAGPLRLLAVGGGLVAAGAGDDVEVLTLDGTVAWSGTFAGLRAARIDGRILLVLVRVGSQNSLWTVDTSRDLRTGPWKLPASPSAGDDVCGDPSGCRPAALRLEDFRAGTAVYVLGRAVHLLRLAGDPSVTIRAPGPGPVHAQLGSSGLFYSYRAPGSPGRGRVAFVPMAALR
jgi:hypothetical protein